MKRSRIRMVRAAMGLFLSITILVVMERFGILGEESIPELLDLPQAHLAKAPTPDNRHKESLLILDDTEVSQRYMEQMVFVLDSMDVGYDVYSADADPPRTMPDFSNYQTVILGAIESERLVDAAFMGSLFEWVDLGGRLFNLTPNTAAQAMEAYQEFLEIETMGAEVVAIDHLQITSDFMLGAEGTEFNLGGPSAYAVDVELGEAATVHALQEELGIPLIWEKEYGEGRIVVNNVGLSGKSSRGMLAAEYSLLMDVFAYPVINSSVFFIDDFPAPFPEGRNFHISQSYDLDVPHFMADVWFPDMMKISKENNIPFTGMLVNTFDTRISPPYNEAVDKEDFTFYGNLLLSLGGELGYHGYNHQPLVLEGSGQAEDSNYRIWDSVKDVMASLEIMVQNTEWMFPQEEVSVYTPADNILSQEVRQAIADDLEEIRTISNLYVASDNEYEQEFMVAADGVIELPRTVSGLEVTHQDRWLAMNELNFHFVNTHFFSPYDLLDSKRGAEKGWEYLKAKFEDYLSWLQDSAPGLRQQKATDGAKAVQRYHASEITRTAEDSTYKIDIENFYDGLYCIVRIREGKIQEVEGGSLTPLTSELYLLEAGQPTVTIYLEE